VHFQFQSEGDGVSRVASFSHMQQLRDEILAELVNPVSLSPVGVEDVLLHDAGIHNHRFYGVVERREVVLVRPEVHSDSVPFEVGDVDAEITSILVKCDLAQAT